MIFKFDYRTIFVLLPIFIGTVFFNGPYINLKILQYRVGHEKKFSACKASAQSITKNGAFNVCEVKDLGGPVGSTTVIKVIVYDTTNALTNRCQNKEAWTKITRQLPMLTMATYERKRINDDYYILSFVFDGGGFANSAC